MKKIFIVILCVCFSFLFFGCETENSLKTAHISDKTGDFSTKYSILVSLDEDDRLTEKYVDIQLKSDKQNQILSVFEENNDALTISLPEKDFWYNFSYLISKANGTKEVGYQKYEDFGTKHFVFMTQNDVDITFRVVCGDLKKTEETQEEVMVLSKPISKEVLVKMKKDKDWLKIKA